VAVTGERIEAPPTVPGHITSDLDAARFNSRQSARHLVAAGLDDED
jgi:hypothetical protein